MTILEDMEFFVYRSQFGKLTPEQEHEFKKAWLTDHRNEPMDPKVAESRRRVEDSLQQQELARKRGLPLPSYPSSQCEEAA